MPKKIRDITNPPPPPPDNDEKAILKLLRSQPDSGFTFRDIELGTGPVAQYGKVEGFADFAAIMLLAATMSSPDKRSGRLMGKLEKLVAESVVLQAPSDGQVYYWIAPDHVAPIG